MKLSEEQFYRQIVDLAHTFGWAVAHFRPAKTAKGWRTPVGADGAGFPDLVMVRIKEGQRIILYVELKSQEGKVTPEQKQWLDLLNGSVWKPSDFNLIVEILR